MSCYICLRAISHDYALVPPREVPLIQREFSYSAFMEREVEKVEASVKIAVCDKALREDQTGTEHMRSYPLIPSLLLRHSRSYSRRRT